MTPVESFAALEGTCEIFDIPAEAVPGMPPVKVLVTRDVPEDEEHNYAGRDVNQGEILYLFRLCTYDCVDVYHGIALSEKPDEYPFFEFPNNAIEAVE